MPKDEVRTLIHEDEEFSSYADKIDAAFMAWRSEVDDPVMIDHVKFSHNPSEVHISLICPECGAPMKLKTGRYGEFLSCSKYPNCKNYF